MKVITIGGAGYWGSKLTRVFASEGHEVVADISLPVRAEDNLRSLSFLHGAQAAVIATPAETHAKLIWLAMDCGLDVLVTKPMALQINQALSIADRARQKKLVVSVDSTFVHSEIFAHLFNVADRLVHYQSSRLACGPLHMTTPPSWDLLSHDVAILLAMGMKVENASGGQDRHNAMLQIDFESGGTAWINASRCYFTKVRNIIFRFEGSHPYVWKDNGLWGMHDGDMDLILLQQTEPLAYVVRDFAARCAKRELTGITDADHGAAVCKVLHETFGMPNLALGLDPI